MTNAEMILEGQLRQCYGRVVYSHKTHEKCADILLNCHKKIQWAQIILSALIASALLTKLFNLPLLVEYEKIGVLLTTFCSTGLVILNYYTNAYDLGMIAQKHRQASLDLWFIREKYFSLLTDLRIGESKLDIFLAQR